MVSLFSLIHGWYIWDEVKMSYFRCVIVEQCWSLNVKYMKTWHFRNLSSLTSTLIVSPSSFSNTSFKFLTNDVFFLGFNDGRNFGSEGFGSAASSRNNSGESKYFPFKILDNFFLLVYNLKCKINMWNLIPAWLILIRWGIGVVFIRIFWGRFHFSNEDMNFGPFISEITFYISSSW